jgi:hypothetical protein
MMTRDLSSYHQPVSDFLSSTGNDNERFRLIRQQVEFFHEQGYLSGIRILDDAQVDALREELSQLADPAHAGNELFLRISFERIGRSEYGSVSCAGCMAHLAWVS